MNFEILRFFKVLFGIPDFCGVFVNEYFSRRIKEDNL